MGHFIVLDLEWNQSPGGRETSMDRLPFEIIEIGAVKLDENLRIISEFSRLVRPQVYKTLHYKISEVTHLSLIHIFCAAVISMIDLLYPQILRSLTNTLFAGDPHLLLKALVPIGIGFE